MQRIVILSLICLMALTTSPAYAGEDYQETWDAFIEKIQAVYTEDDEIREELIYELINEYEDICAEIGTQPFNRELAYKFDADVAEAISYFIKFDAIPEVRIAAIRFLTKPYIEMLQFRRIFDIAIDDIDPDVRRVAAWAVAQRASWFPPDGRSGFELLVLKGLLDEDTEVRIQAFAAVPDFYYNSGAIRAAIASALNDENFRIRFLAAYNHSICRKIPATEESVAILMEVFDYPEFKKAAIFAIGYSKELGMDAIPVLLEIANSKPAHPTTRDILDDWQPGDDLVEILREKKPDSLLLAELETYDADWYEPEYKDYWHGYIIMGNWGNGWTQYFTSWSTWDSVRSTAVSSLGNISWIAGDPLILLQFFDDESPLVRRAAIEPFSWHPTTYEEALEPLISVLENDDDGRVIVAATYAIALFGPAAADALPILHLRLEASENSDDGYHFKSAIEKIEGTNSES